MGKHTLSAGLLMFRKKPTAYEFFLVHPGGPYFRQKDAGWWTIPKGEPDPEEELLATAIREFQEETGIIPQPPFLPLGEVKQKGGKKVYAWAFAGDWQPAQGIQCNTFRIEWPPRSGQYQSFAEIDQAAWMEESVALKKINAAQAAFIHRLTEQLTKEA